MKSLPANLRRRADELGLTQIEIARRAGLTERQYSHYVTGNREPKLDALVKIARALLTTPNELLGFNTDVKNSRRRQLADRLVASAISIGLAELEVLVAQAEALVGHRKDSRR